MKSNTVPPEVMNVLLDGLADCGIAIALFDPQDRLRYANAMWREALAIAPDAFPHWADMMRNCHATRRGLVIACEDIEAWIAQIATRRRQVAKRTFQSDLSDGRWFWITETSHADGWLLALGSDVSALKRHEQQLEEAHALAVADAYTDALTGLYNRRYVFGRFNELAAGLADSGSSLGMAIVDLDHFKKINDVYGHPVGDRVLQHFAGLLRKQLRPTDLSGRMGGEEFILLMPGTSLADAVRAVERLLGELRASRPLADIPELAYTFSAGLTRWRSADSVACCIERADRALYAAKHGGRNRVVAIDDDD
jgi:diguanylate cyclase (GGDEF)-like protein